MNTILTELEPALAWLLRVSGQAAVLVVLILLLQTICRERLTPRWRYALWLLLVVRLSLPVPVTSRLSVFNLARVGVPATAAEISLSPSSEEKPAYPAPPKAASRASAAAPTPGPAVATPAPAAVTPTVPGHAAAEPGWPWKSWAALLWLAGVTLLALRILVQNVGFYRRLRWAPTVTDAAAWKTLEACRQLMGVRQRLVLVETALVHSPALYGFLRVHLLLPENTLATLTTEELRYVFLHELAHVKRRDMPVNWVVTLLQVAHWFNPLIWVGFRRMAADRELATDALALSRLEARENVAYGNAILKLLKKLLSPSPRPGLVGILEDKNQMKRRITMIAKFKKSNRWPVLAVAAFASLALIALTDARSEPGPPLKLTGKPPEVAIV